MFVTWCIRPLMFTIYPLWIVIAFILHCCLCLRFTHFELLLVLFYIVVSVDKWLREHRLWRRWRNRTQWTSGRPRTSRSPTVGCYSSSSESEAHCVYTWILQIRRLGEKGGGGRVTVNMNLDYSAVYTDLEQYATVIKIS